MTHSFSTCAAKTGPPIITHASAIAMVTSGSSGRHASSCRYALGRGHGKDHLFMGQVVQVSSTPHLNVRTHLCYPLHACAQSSALWDTPVNSPDLCWACFPGCEFFILYSLPSPCHLVVGPFFLLLCHLGLTLLALFSLDVPRSCLGYSGK